MPSKNFTGPVEADIREIWTTLSGFGHIADWHPDITSSRIDNGMPETMPGAVRHLDMRDGNVIKEELLTRPRTDDLVLPFHALATAVGQLCLCHQS